MPGPPRPDMSAASRAVGSAPTPSSKLTLLAETHAETKGDDEEEEEEVC